MRKQNFAIEGMNCAACKARIEKVVAELTGVSVVTVSLLQNSMSVVFDESVCSVEVISKAVSSVGYGIQPIKSTKDLNQNEQAKLSKSIKSLIASCILTAILLLVAMGPMFGLNILPKATANANTQLGLCLLVIGLNWHYFKNGYKALFSLAPNMDSLVAIGATASLCASSYNLMLIPEGLSTFDMHHQYSLYFEGVATILTLVSLGKYFESRAKVKAVNALAELYDLAPATVIRRILKSTALCCPTQEMVEEEVYIGIEAKDPNQRESADDSIYVQEKIALERVRVGDEIIVRAGDNLGIDGEIIEGHGVFDESSITGEFELVSKEVGAKVYSASYLRYGYIVVRAEQVGQDTLLSKIIALVDAANQQKAPIARLADKISFYFVHAVLLLAAATLLYWLVEGAPMMHAINFAVSVLVVSCPCALGLATPTAIMVGTARAAKLGVLFKKPEVIEKLHQVDIMVLDKTGTLTEGKMQVVGFNQPRVRSVDMSMPSLLSLAQALEERSEHPIGEAVVAYCVQQLDQIGEHHSDGDSARTLSSTISEFYTHEGKGVEGVMDGVRYFLGSTNLLKEQCAAGYDDGLEAEDLAPAAATVVHLFTEQGLLCSFYIGDRLRKGAMAVMHLLQNFAVRPVIVSGDNINVVSEVAKQVNVVNFKASCLPQDKVNFIEQLQYREHVVAMVGDGINDAPSLSASDVGVSIVSGTDIAQSCSSLVLMKQSLFGLVSAIMLSHMIMRNIKENLFWAFIYNLVCIPLAMGLFFEEFGLKLDPMIAAFLMSISSICVVSNALRLRRQPLKVDAGNATFDLETIEEQPKFFEEIEQQIGALKNSHGYSLGVDTDDTKEVEHKSLKQASDHQNNVGASLYSMPNQAESGAEESIWMDKVIHIEGMNCAHCVRSVTEALNAVPGCERVEVSLGEKVAHVKTNGQVSDDSLIKAITDKGFSVVSVVNIN